MTLDYQNKVAIPPHSVRVSNGDKVYIQYTLEAYRNEKGSLPVVVSLWKLDPETGLMIPNRRNYKLFDKQPMTALPSVIRSQGTHAAFRGVAQKLGVEKVVEKVLGKRADTPLSPVKYKQSLGLVGWVWKINQEAGPRKCPHPQLRREIGLHLHPP